MMISQSTIERIFELPIQEVISHYVDLKKAGSTFKAKSPFVDEKTASFYVVPSKNIFKDFSSGKGGGSIRFVMEKTGKSYPDAIKEIAELCNIRVEYDELSQADIDLALDKENLYLVNEAAARKYREQLTEADAIFLTDQRAFTLDTMLQWQIGYAPGKANGFSPNDWRFMVQLVGDKNRKAAIELGLIQEKNGHTYDFFRHRVMFPIHDHLGRIVGFGGRALQTDEFNAKYINSPESKIYHKDQVLFGLYFAQKAIKDAACAYLMEGYTDVISFHQAGFANSVGTCGTALTESQCKLLKRYTNKVVLFRDGDNAGKKAALRDIDILVQQGFSTAIVPMPDLGDDRKVDPDELTRLFKS